MLFKETKIQNYFLAILIAFSVMIVIFVMTLSLVVIYTLPPQDFPPGQVIKIEKGDTLKQVALDFKEKNLIRSPFLFETIAWFLKTDKKIKAGEYFFEDGLTAFELMDRITEDSYKKELIKITIPEGYNLRDIGFVFENLRMWQAEEVWEVTGLPATKDSMEGFLFPDTYFVPAGINPSSMVQVMRDNFEKKVAEALKEKIEESERSLFEIITMASLIEKEAATEEDRKLISGILWKRLDAGMPLQVDAVFPYIIGKYSLQLTTEDLKIDSPYNTYLYKGLPLGPIANPGLESIITTLKPEESPYWYYLSDKEGNVYYSTTYQQHLIKKEKYLR